MSSCTTSLSPPPPRFALIFRPFISKSIGFYNLYSNLIPATERYVALSHFRKKSTGLAPNTSEARHKRCEVLLVTRTLTLRQIGVVAGLFKFVDERIQKSRFEVGSAFTLFRYRGTFKRCLLRWPQN